RAFTTSGSATGPRFTRAPTADWRRLTWPPSGSFRVSMRTGTASRASGPRQPSDSTAQERVTTSESCRLTARRAGTTPGSFDLPQDVGGVLALTVLAVPQDVQPVTRRPALVKGLAGHQAGHRKAGGGRKHPQGHAAGKHATEPGQPAPVHDRLPPSLAGGSSC